MLRWRRCVIIFDFYTKLKDMKTYAPENVQAEDMYRVTAVLR